MPSYASTSNMAHVEQLKSQSKLCCSCSSSLETDLFSSENGLICKNCAASIVLHQLRLKQFPIRIPLKTSAPICPLDLLYAVLPVPVMSTLIRMSFSHFYPLHNPKAIFTKCPQCETLLVVDSPNDYGTCSCSECYIHFCYRCFAEPHWPMSCEEFEQWSQKWEEQYPIEKLCLDEDENVLRINCVCGSTFFVAETSAHGTYCPNKSCGHRYDKAGLMRSKRDLWFWYTARDRQKRIEGRGGEMGKDGIPIVAECISQKRMIRREFASICAEVRNMRYDRSRRRKFKEAVMEIASSREEQIALLDIRVTVKSSPSVGRTLHSLAIFTSEQPLYSTLEIISIEAS
ncbi:IBR domain protein [Oesophagostomum dentatum]|uniref:IBR domain protein n=1 Tax=Oesophagostomum dentatum TaxID=61180 RepID=A0A0B1S8H4_OESDE|nr:IBR domain protein [Oesophagostomum dentatum]